jgi:SNF family Na+-dependent transporter
VVLFVLGLTMAALSSKAAFLEVLAAWAKEARNVAHPEKALPPSNGEVQAFFNALSLYLTAQRDAMWQCKAAVSAAVGVRAARAPRAAACAGLFLEILGRLIRPKVLHL